MRGEETQLLGLITRHKLADATVCLPGTHSKWATVKDGAVAEFKTFMTGEAPLPFLPLRPCGPHAC